jgi:hypothetical protein
VSVFARSMGSEIARCAAAFRGGGDHQETRRLCLLFLKSFGSILLKPQLVPILAEFQVYARPAGVSFH